MLDPDSKAIGGDRTSEENQSSRSVPITPLQYDFKIDNAGNGASQSADSILENEQAIADKAKLFQPGIKRLWGIADGGCSRFIGGQARKNGNYTKEEIKEFEKSARADDDTNKAIIESGSKIAARYIKSGEGMDWAVLIGALTNHGANLITTARIISRRKASPQIDRPENESR